MPETTDRTRWIALYVLCAGVLMIVLDGTVVNVALETIQEDLGFSAASLAWVVNAYLIAFGGLVLLAGRVGDLVGRRNVFLGGLAVFTLASMLCGIATSAEVLVFGRFLQGAGGAFTSAVILGMIITMFPEPAERAKAIGVYAFVASAGGSIGLLAGGVLVQSLSWHWIFFVNVPIALATALAAMRLIPADQGLGLKEGSDIPGAVLITSALMLGVFTIVKPAAEQGWTANETLALGALSVALFLGFLLREHAAKQPLMPLRMFRSRNVSGANLVQILTVPGMFCVFFLGSLYMQRVLGYDALQTGLAFLPMTIAMGTMSMKFSAALIGRFGPKNTLIPGLVSMVVALGYFTLAPVDAGYALYILPVMILCGIGAGTCFPATMNMAMSGATPSDAGLASGLVNTSAQVGGALGLAVLATLSASHTAGITGMSELEALNAGYHFAYLVGAGILVVAIIVAVVVLKPAPEGTQVPPVEEPTPAPQAELSAH